MAKRLAFCVLCARLLFGGVQSYAQSWGREYVYVETNVRTGNSIAAFTRNADGSLSEIPGSPFSTGGTGVQYTGVNVGPLDSDQEIVVDTRRRLLFAVNSGSDSISVFHVGSNGALSPIHGSPFASGGNNPVSLALVGNTLFVVNKSGDFGRPTGLLPNYTALRLLGDGSLVKIDGGANESDPPRSRSYASVQVAIGSSPSQAFVPQGTNLLFGTDFMAGLIQRFQFDWNGRLQQLEPLALPAGEHEDEATPRLPLGLWAHPSRPLLYVGFVTDSKLGVYRYTDDGSLSFLRAVPNAGKAICWIRTNRRGDRLYTTNTITNSVSVYDSSEAETPVQIQELPLSGLGNVLQFSLSGDERYLYALSSRGTDSIPEGEGNLLHVLQIQKDGRLLETGSPVVFNLPAGTRPQGVTVATLY